MPPSPGWRSPRTGKEPLFESLKGYLTGDAAVGSYQQVGSAIGMTEGALKVAVHRLRRRYRTLLYDEIAQTVATRAGRLELLAWVAALVRCAHEAGVIHGGIKPSNVLVSGRAAAPSVKVTDFGLRLADERADNLAMSALAAALLVR